MASTARAYAPKRRYEEVPRPRPRIEVHPGQYRRADAGQYARAMSVFKIVVVAVALLTVMAVARIWLTSASLDVLTQTNAVESSIEESREIGDSLDAQYYALSNSTSIREYAANTLGMVAPGASAEVIDVTSDLVTSVFSQVSANAQSMIDNAVAEAAASLASVSTASLAGDASSADEGTEVADAATAESSEAAASASAE